METVLLTLISCIVIIILWSKNFLTSSTRPTGSSNPAIILTNISKNYGATPALVDVSFDVLPGEIFGLLGPNGAGKTTAIRILKGMIKPTSGTAQVLNHRIDRETNWVKQHTGYLPEEGSLLTRLTPLELCEFIGGLFGVSTANSRARALEFLKMFNLLEKKDELVENLSKGMKQKLSIICSIIHDPEIVFMDEPLSSLDPSASKMVKDFIRYLSRSKNKTIIISSHRLAMVQDVCDRVAILHKGVILTVDYPKKIMEKTQTSTLEEAYLSIIPGYAQPVFASDGSIVEKGQVKEQEAESSLSNKLPPEEKAQKEKNGPFDPPSLGSPETRTIEKNSEKDQDQDQDQEQ
ncbi:MAG: ATP-binding cassette domain-containing protein [Candidatus Heimdallarchaeota archaeon]|nr:ATP-binding cassette domain-containing protein [Candidatus Heimdallarchaeota archaeon]